MKPATRRVLAWSAALLVLGVVFMAYLRPGFAVDFATLVWSCF